MELKAALRERLTKLADKDMDFAASMLSKPVTDKTRLWMGKLIERADNPQSAERVKTAIGGLEGVNSLFDKARGKLKAPAIVIAIANLELRLNVAGERARVPGSINVATNEGGYGSSRWFGRILQDGVFEASPREPTPAGLIEGLQRFAADPAKVAAEYGKLSGRCCWCNLKLTDPRSTAVGFGATCAKNWGLPYPTLSEARAASPFLAVAA